MHVEIKVKSYLLIWLPIFRLLESVLFYYFAFYSTLNIQGVVSTDYSITGSVKYLSKSDLDPQTLYPDSKEQSTTDHTKKFC